MKNRTKKELHAMVKNLHNRIENVKQEMGQKAFEKALIAETKRLGSVNAARGWIASAYNTKYQTW